MNIKKILTKAVATITCGMMFFATVATAAATPNKSNAADELDKMKSLAACIGLDAASISSLENQCIDGAQIVKAINSAVSLSKQIKGIVYYDYSDEVFPTPKDVTEKLYGYGSTPAYVRDNTTLTANFTNALASASLGSTVKLSMGKTRPAAGTPNTNSKDSEYYATLSLNLNNTQKLQLVNFPGNSISSQNDVSSFFLDYTNFLTTLYNYYNIAGCYANPTPPLPDSNGTVVVVPVVPVITVINVINVNVNIYAGTFRTPSTVNPREKKDKTVKNAVIYAEDRVLRCGDKFEYLKGVTAKDNGGKGKDITKKISLDGKINTYCPGKYVITYKVTGANGVEVKKQVTITVTAQTKSKVARPKTAKRYFK